MRTVFGKSFHVENFPYNWNVKSHIFIKVVGTRPILVDNIFLFALNHCPFNNGVRTRPGEATL